MHKYIFVYLDLNLDRNSGNGFEYILTFFFFFFFKKENFNWFGGIVNYLTNLYTTTTGLKYRSSLIFF